MPLYFTFSQAYYLFRLPTRTKHNSFHLRSFSAVFRSPFRVNIFNLTCTLLRIRGLLLSHVPRAFHSRIRRNTQSNETGLFSEIDNPRSTAALFRVHDFQNALFFVYEGSYLCVWCFARPTTMMERTAFDTFGKSFRLLTFSFVLFCRKETKPPNIDRCHAGRIISSPPSFKSSFALSCDVLRQTNTRCAPRSRSHFLPSKMTHAKRAGSSEHESRI